MNRYLKHYVVHPDGNIISKNTGKLLKPSRYPRGYLYVTLYDWSGGYKKYLVHRLVAIVHLPNPKKLRQVNHKDLDKSNNNVANLEWCNALYNIRHARSNGVNIYTEERAKKISLAKTGVPRSSETREKLSKYWKEKYKKGYVSPMIGKHLSSEAIKKRTHGRYHYNTTVSDCPVCLANNQFSSGID